ncbi:hypothetical protein SAY86_017804 [Trapa natans]|uniref:Association with the SNF1 complex (ASC) domain-containing protein n=1 Tax=Trapa natans TaxID=22666 RepID=A0AAN7LQY1_TRANT|nr:hypothetical protein SAY86_017804 [Trapa natans]
MGPSYSSGGKELIEIRNLGNSAFDVTILGLFNMNIQVPADNEEVRTVVGFEAPRSPESSYNNEFPVNGDDMQEPPLVPQQLWHPILGCLPNRNDSENLPLPLDALLNHLYIENRETHRSVVALGFSHRFRSKYVSVVLYKAVKGSSGTGTGS